MKKSIITLLISVCFFLNIIIIVPVLAINTFKEGLYKSTDFNYSQNNTYNVKNISSTNNAYILIFDDNLIQIQSLRLEPNSATYNLAPLTPNYRVAVIGKGEVFIDQSTSQ